MATEICITVDVEFSIAGAFTRPDLYEPIALEAVNCVVNGEEHGLGFLLDTFRTFGIRATFFVETLNHCYFGDDPMRGVAQRILSEGHDVQLHVHPCWLHFRDPNWRSKVGVARPNDSCAGRARQELADIIGIGIETLQRWGVPRPIALRTGSLHVDRNVYAAMSEAGIGIGSNIGLGYNPPSDSSLHLKGGRHWIDGVLELPVLTYTDARAGHWTHRRMLTVISTSWRETRVLLRKARAIASSPVVLLTHPFEYIWRGDFRYKRTAPNRVTQRRLRQLCRFIQDHDSHFIPVTFSQMKQKWMNDPATNDPELSVPFSLAVYRTLENRLMDFRPLSFLD